VREQASEKAEKTEKTEIFIKWDHDFFTMRCENMRADLQ